MCESESGKYENSHDGHRRNRLNKTIATDILDQKTM